MDVWITPQHVKDTHNPVVFLKNQWIGFSWLKKRIEFDQTKVKSNKCIVVSIKRIKLPLGNYSLSFNEEGSNQEWFKSQDSINNESQQ